MLFFFCCRMFLDSVMPSRANAMNCLVQCFPQCFAVQRADWKLQTFWWQILLTFARQHPKSPVAKSVVWNPFTTDSCRKLGISLKISPWNMEEAFSSKNSSLAIILSLCLSVCFFVSCSVSCKTYGSPGHKQTWLLCNAGVNFIKGVRGLYIQSWSLRNKWVYIISFIINKNSCWWVLAVHQAFNLWLT